MSPRGVEQLWNEMRFSVQRLLLGWYSTCMLWHKMAALTYVCEEGGYGG